MVGESFLHRFHVIVTLSPLVQNHVNDFVVFADILRRCRHELVNDLAEKIHVASRIISYSINKVHHRFLVLFTVSKTFQC